MKVLVTGGCGYIGSATARYLRAQGVDVQVIDDLSEGHRQAWDGPLEVLDLLDRDALHSYLKGKTFDGVIHFAARCYVGESVEQPVRYWRANVVPVIHLCEALEGVPFVISSTCATYGEPQTEYLSETHSQNPVNPYGASKLGAEGLFCSFSNTEKLPVTALRFMPMYGPRCRDDMMVRRLFERILKGESIEQFGDGSAERDWLYVADGAEAVVKALENPPNTDRYRVLNIGTGVSTTLSELIKLCEEVAGRRANIIQRSTPIGDATVTGVADWSLAEHEISWRPNTPLSEGLEMTFEYFKERIVPQSGYPTKH